MLRISRLLILAAVPGTVALAQQDGRLAPEGINDPPTLEERLVEERVIADRAAAEVLDAEEQGAEVPLDAPGESESHATSAAPAELVALASREPQRFIGKTLVLDNGVDAVKVGPVLELRKRIVDQEAYVIVDAAAYFNTPTRYAVAVRDLERIEGELLVTPEVEGMHLRGLDYYPEDFTDLVDTSPEDVLADNVDLSEEGAEAATGDEPGEITIRRF
jgi:hypothetical protein